MIPLKDNIPTARFPVVTILLIVVNMAVFGWQLTQSSSSYSSAAFHELGVARSDQAVLQYGAIPYRLTHPGESCAVGVAVRGSARPSAAVVCQGTKAYDTARQLARSSSGRIPFAPLDSPPWWATVFTSMFMHGGLLHIGFNMLFLWIFGNNVEDAMGRRRFVCFYLLAGIAAAYAQAALDTSGTEPAIGASGAIAGVLGGYLLLHPRARVLTLLILVFFVTLVEVPAVLLLGAWFALQFVPALGQATSNIGGSGGGIAYFAHVGGFLFGLLAIRAFARRARAGPAMALGR